MRIRNRGSGAVRTIIVGATVLLAGAAWAAGGQAPADGSVAWMKLAATPPMGWNSWNKFGCNVSETS